MFGLFFCRHDVIVNCMEGPVAYRDSGRDDTHCVVEWCVQVRSVTSCVSWWRQQSRHCMSAISVWSARSFLNHLCGLVQPVSK